MNSKNYNAAQKHFEKEREKINKELKIQKEKACDCETKYLMEKSKVHNLKLENEQLHDWVDRLLKYTELSRSDIKVACEIDKSTAEKNEVINSLAKNMLPLFQLLSKA